MKQLNVLIIEDQVGIAKAITRSIEKLLSYLGVDINFFYAREYEEARLAVMKMDYDIISLDGILLNFTPSFPLITTILNLHPQAVVFFLSSSETGLRSAKEFGMPLTFLKGNAQIINQEDLLLIKKALVVKGIINYGVLYSELTDAVLIFSETINDAIGPEDNDGQECLSVAKILNSNGINYAIVDRGMHMKIFVDGLSIDVVKELAQKSNLEFWSKWSNKFF
jgi:hypothetical protein